MTKMIRKMSCMAAALVFTASLAMAAPKAQTFTGEVSDAMCGAKHMESPAAKCTRDCVKEGSAYALIVGNKVYKLSGKTDGLDALAGDKATVTGTAQGDTIDVASVSAAK